MIVYLGEQQLDSVWYQCQSISHKHSRACVVLSRVTKQIVIYAHA